MRLPEKAYDLLYSTDPKHEKHNRALDYNNLNETNFLECFAYLIKYKAEIKQEEKMNMITKLISYVDEGFDSLDSFVCCSAVDALAIEVLHGRLQ